MQQPLLQYAKHIVFYKPAGQLCNSSSVNDKHRVTRHGNATSGAACPQWMQMVTSDIRGGNAEQKYNWFALQIIYIYIQCTVHAVYLWVNNENNLLPKYFTTNLLCNLVKKNDLISVHVIITEQQNKQNISTTLTTSHNYMRNRL